MGGTVSTTPKNLHRDTLRTCLRVIARVETLDQARTQLCRLLGSFDKLRGQGLGPDVAIAEAATRIERCPPPPPPVETPPPAPADLRPVRRYLCGPGRADTPRWVRAQARHQASRRTPP
jgi:hypothetical protein